MFLILIAVGLFAALSYVVTQSTRSGSGSTSAETAKLQAGQILNLITQYRQIILREEMSGGFKQVVGGDSPANDNGTCYEGQTATTPCKTIGLFSPQAGGILPPTQFPGTPDYWPAVAMSIQNYRAQVNGVDVGSSATDTALLLSNISKDTCFKLNQLLNGTYGAAMSFPFSLVPSTSGMAQWYWDSEVNSWSSGANGFPGYAFTASSGCWDNSDIGYPYFHFFSILTEK